ncbi:hypothetical protein WJX81_001491 [Elliptochloris bilobata]|uniref:C3H1-type domain-containing protein n=1 Tax=Elliptochloris bilobata TaxID=381761 RepID=A0AAW1S0T6_9CHLO
MYQRFAEAPTMDVTGVPRSYSPPSSSEDFTHTDSFRMFSFKIQPCPIKTTHPWEQCCYAHPHENARRRDPRKYRYIAEPCPDYKRGICLLGNQCPYAHGVYERNLHPSKYRTHLCTEGERCSRRVCFFAHSHQQLRMPVGAWSLEEAEYVRQVLLEKIIGESEQTALREQAAAALAAPGGLGMRAGAGLQPPNVHQAHQYAQQAIAQQMAEQQAQGAAAAEHAQRAAYQQAAAAAAFAQAQATVQAHVQAQHAAQAQAQMNLQAQAAVSGAYPLGMSAYSQVGSPTNAPTTPPAAAQMPARQGSSSPVHLRMREAGGRMSLDSRMSAATEEHFRQLQMTAAATTMGSGGLTLPPPLVVPSPPFLQDSPPSPNISQAMVQAHQAGSVGMDDSEGPRMSMAMRRQLGIAPAKSPSKATSPHGPRGRGSPPMSPYKTGSAHAPPPVTGVHNAFSAGTFGSQQNLIALQHQAAMMQSAANAAAADPFGAYASGSPPGMGHIGHMQAQLNAAMEGARASEESEYGDLVARLHGVRFSFLGEGAGVGGGMLHPSPGSGGSGIGGLGGVGGGMLHPSGGSGGSGIGSGGGLLHPSPGSGASGGKASAGEAEDTHSPAHAGEAAQALQPGQLPPDFDQHGRSSFFSY